MANKFVLLKHVKLMARRLATHAFAWWIELYEEFVCFILIICHGIVYVSFVLVRCKNSPDSECLANISVSIKFSDWSIKIISRCYQICSLDAFFEDFFFSIALDEKKNQIKKPGIGCINNIKIRLDASTYAFGYILTICLKFYLSTAYSESRIRGQENHKRRRQKAKRTKAKCGI